MGIGQWFDAIIKNVGLGKYGSLAFLCECGHSCCDKTLRNGIDLATNIEHRFPCSKAWGTKPLRNTAITAYLFLGLRICCLKTQKSINYD